LSAYVPSKIKPRYRGVSHFIGFCISLAASVALLGSPKSGEAYLGGVVYAVTLSLMLGISALYHRPMWSYAARRILRRVDHSGIFLMIAGSYTAFWTLTPPAHRSNTLLWLMWISAIVGVVTFTLWTDMPRVLRAATYVVLGLSSLPLVFELPAVFGWPTTLTVLASAAIYILGAAVYARRWPNPDPRVFGYHEIFHLLVLLAASLHFGLIASRHWELPI
jgi:hemolysin III